MAPRDDQRWPPSHMCLLFGFGTAPHFMLQDLTNKAINENQHLYFPLSTPQPPKATVLCSGAPFLVSVAHTSGLSRGDKVPKTLPTALVRVAQVLHFIITLHPLALKPSWLVIPSEVLSPPPPPPTPPPPASYHHWRHSLPVSLKDQDCLGVLCLGKSLFCTGTEALTSL